jgi:hypothetical protein
VPDAFCEKNAALAAERCKATGTGGDNGAGVYCTKGELDLMEEEGNYNA